MTTKLAPDFVEEVPSSGRLLSLPSDVLLLGLLSDPDRSSPSGNSCPLVEARRLPPAERYGWVKSLDADTKSQLIARYLYGVV